MSSTLNTTDQTVRNRYAQCLNIIKQYEKW